LELSVIRGRLDCYSAVDVAERTGLPYQQVARFMRGDARKPSYEFVRQIVICLHLDKKDPL